jgi:ABC-type dipeptide/oligopeptide/nickel transport system permease subunit
MTDAATPEVNKRDVRRRRSLLAQTVIRLFGRTGAAVGGIWILITAIFAAWAPFIANSRPFTWQVQDEASGQWVREFPLFQLLTPQDVMFALGFLLAAACVACYRAGGKMFWVWLAGMCSIFAGSMLFYLIDDLGTTAQAVDTALQKLEADPYSGTLQQAVSSAKWALAGWWVLWIAIGLFIAGLFVLSIARLSKHLPGLIGAVAVSAAVLGGLLLVPSLRVEPPKLDEIPTAESYRIALDEGIAKQAYFALIPYSPDDTLKDQSETGAGKIGVTNKTRSPGAHPTLEDIANEMQFQAGSVYGGMRLQNLVGEDGKPVPQPKTPEEARKVADLMWQAYQESDGFIPAYADEDRQRALDMLDGMAQITPKTRLHMMGTTISGQDLASRMVHGSRIALYIGFISTGIAIFIGIFIGGLLGYFAGWVDLIGLRLVEIFASIPVIMLLIMIVAFYGRSLVLMMVVIGLTGWVGYAYFVRAEFLKLRKMDYVMAARASGTPLYLILFKHMLPNGVAPVLVGASFGIAGGIMTEATLSFLGLGLEDEPSWGQMLNQARETGKFAWWLAIFPGLGIFLTVFAYNLIGEALRDVIDPRAVD